MIILIQPCHFAFICAEKLTLGMKDGLVNSKYKQAEYEKLQAVVEAKRQESELIGQKVDLVINQYLMPVFVIKL